MTAAPVLAAVLQVVDDGGHGGVTGIEHLAEAAVELERVGFAFVVLDDVRSGSVDMFEPYTLASALAFVTDRIGFAVRSRTAGLHPYHVARRLASLDHLSRGRAAWFVGGDPDPQRAAEYVDVTRALWDSWDDDAFVRDVDAGRYYDPTLLHTPEYDGAYYRVRGPLNISRPPQGNPVLVHDLCGTATEPDLDADVVVVAAPDQPVESLRRDPLVLVRTALIGAEGVAGWTRDGVADGALIEGTWTIEHVRALVALGSALASEPSERRAASSTPCRLRDRLGLAHPPRRDHVVAGSAS